MVEILSVDVVKNICHILHFIHILKQSMMDDNLKVQLSTVQYQQKKANPKYKSSNWSKYSH